MTHKFPTKIETERLVIRIPEMHEAEEQHSHVLDTVEQLREFLPWAHPTPTLENRKNFIQKRCDDAEKAFDACLYKKDTDEFIGGCGFVNSTEDMVEIGYWCSIHHQGNGYITEAVDALVNFAFNELKLPRVEMGYHSGNEASKAVGDRCGFKHLRTKKDDITIPFTGNTHDLYITVKYNPNTK